MSLLLVAGTGWVFDGDPDGPWINVAYTSIFLWIAWALVASVVMPRATAPADEGYPPAT